MKWHTRNWTQAVRPKPNLKVNVGSTIQNPKVNEILILCSIKMSILHSTNQWFICRSNMIGLAFSILEPSTCFFTFTNAFVPFHAFYSFDALQQQQTTATERMNDRYGLQEFLMSAWEPKYKRSFYRNVRSLLKSLHFNVSNADDPSRFKTLEMNLAKYKM